MGRLVHEMGDVTLRKLIQYIKKTRTIPYVITPCYNRMMRFVIRQDTQWAYYRQITSTCLIGQLDQLAFPQSSICGTYGASRSRNG